MHSNSGQEKLWLRKCIIMISCWMQKYSSPGSIKIPTSPYYQRILRSDTHLIHCHICKWHTPCRTMHSYWLQIISLTAFNTKKVVLLLTFLTAIPEPAIGDNLIKWLGVFFAVVMSRVSLWAATWHHNFWTGNPWYFVFVLLRLCSASLSKLWQALQKWWCVCT